MLLHPTFGQWNKICLKGLPFHCSIYKKKIFKTSMDIKMKGYVAYILNFDNR